jgi:hypothetical protein
LYEDDRKDKMTTLQKFQRDKIKALIAKQATIPNPRAAREQPPQYYGKIVANGHNHGNDVYLTRNKVPYYICRESGIPYYVKPHQKVEVDPSLLAEMETD